MNSFQIWSKAQWYNSIIIVIIFLVLVIEKSLESEIYAYDFALGIPIFVVLIIISFIGGIPLIGLFKLIQYGIEKSALNIPSKRFLEVFVYPITTFLYLVILSFLLDLNDFEKINYLETLAISSPAIISTLISVLVNQYQFKKNTENEQP